MLESDPIFLEMLQEAVDDWLIVLPLDQRKDLTLVLFVTFRRRHKMGVMDAATEAGSVTDFGERTFHRYWKVGSENGGSFDEKQLGEFNRSNWMTKNAENVHCSGSDSSLSKMANPT